MHGNSLARRRINYGSAEPTACSRQKTCSNIITVIIYFHHKNKHKQVKQQCKQARDERELDKQDSDYNYCSCLDLRTVITFTVLRRER